MQCDKNLDDHQDDFGQRIDKADTILDLQILSQHLRSMQLDKVFELNVDDSKLLSDELLEHKNVFIFVDVVETVDVRTKGSPQLPSVCLVEALQAILIGM
jgi:hypothetical protein